MDRDGHGDGAQSSSSCSSSVAVGQASGNGDCDDANPRVNPGQLDDDCDGVDNDCDGTPDQAGPMRFEDMDGDGDGAGGAELGICADGVSMGGDCNDAAFDVRPGALEICDGIDNDCDKVLDDAAAATVAGVNYSSIEDAVAAKNGPVVICPGVHSVPTLQATKGGSDLTLVGAQGSGATTLQSAQGGGIAHALEGATLTIDGLSLMGSTAAAAVLVQGPGALTIVNSRLHGNDRLAILLSNHGIGFPLRAELTGVELDDNHGVNGGALYASGDIELDMADSVLSNNSSELVPGVFHLRAVGSLAPQVEIRNSVFVDNVGGGVGIDMAIESAPSVFVLDTDWGTPNVDDNSPTDVTWVTGSWSAPGVLGRIWCQKQSPTAFGCN